MKGNSWELLTGFGFVHGGRKIQSHGVLFWRGCYQESEKVQSLILVFKSDHQEDVQWSEREYGAEAVTPAHKKREWEQISSAPIRLLSGLSEQFDCLFIYLFWNYLFCKLCNYFFLAFSLFLSSFFFGGGVETRFLCVTLAFLELAL